MNDARDPELLGYELLRARAQHPELALSSVYDSLAAVMAGVPGHATTAALEARARLNGDLARVSRVPPRG